MWHGKPNPWIAARQYMYTLLFMTVWTGGVLFGAWNMLLGPKANANLNAPLPALFILGFMVMVGAGLWIKALRSFSGCWRTAYAVTDRRVVVVADGEAARSLSGGALGDISRAGGERQGSLIFGPVSGAGRYSPGTNTGFYGIPDPARVEALIYKTLIVPHKGGAAK